MDEQSRRDVEEHLLRIELAIDRSAAPREPARWERALKDAAKRFAAVLRLG